MNKKQLINELKQEGFPDFIIKAFEKVKREKFIPEEFKESAYLNQPLPIAIGSTISQPYTIAFMLNLLELDKLKNNNYDNLVIDNANKNKIKKIKILEKQGELKILEIGSGSGYVLALINEILNILKIKNAKIYGIEIINELVKRSQKILKTDKKIKIIKTDGSKGLPEKAPFDRILVSAAFEKIPENLFDQLKNSGILVTPVRNSIFRFKKINNKIESNEFPGFVFVPVVEDRKV